MTTTFNNEENHRAEILNHDDTQAFNLLFNNLEYRVSEEDDDTVISNLTTGIIASIVFAIYEEEEEPFF